VQAELQRLDALDTERRAIHDQCTIEVVRKKHWELYELSLAKGDYSNATANIVALGKSCGAYTEGNRIDVRVLTDYTEAQRIEAKKITALLVRQGAVGSLPAPGDVSIIDNDTGADEGLTPRATVDMLLNPDEYPAQVEDDDDLSDRAGSEEA